MRAASWSNGVPIQTWPSIAQGKPVRITPRSHSSAMKLATKPTAGVRVCRASAAAAPQNRPRPLDSRTTAKGAIQPWAAMSIRNGSTIQDRARAKWPVPAAKPTAKAEREVVARATSAVTPAMATRVSGQRPQGA